MVVVESRELELITKCHLQPLFIEVITDSTHFSAVDFYYKNGACILHIQKC